MKNVAKLNKGTASRSKQLGDIGEKLIESILARNNFTNIKNLNHHKVNFPYADIYAERDGVKYVISVKTRNKYEFGSGRINPRYKLGSKCYQNAPLAEKQFDAVAAWVTISLDEKNFSVYFGTLSSLNGSKAVKMTTKHLNSYECLAKDESHEFDYERLKNTYETEEINLNSDNQILKEIK
jgi:hypothetical protein